MKNDIVKIGDFGISRTISETKTIFGEGTFCYMSPEIIQAKSNQDYSFKTDVW
jgi:serine/threonine protein kinase